MEFIEQQGSKFIINKPRFQLQRLNLFHNFYQYMIGSTFCKFEELNQDLDPYFFECVNQLNKNEWFKILVEISIDLNA